MSFMEKIFGGLKPSNMPPQPVSIQQPGPQPNPTNNLQTPPHTQTQQTQQTAPNGVIPQNAGTTDVKDKEQSPVEKFKDLWEPPKTDPSNLTPSNDGGFDPQKMMEAAGKVDFAKVISQEDLQKIAAGGQEAVAAFANALNKTAQTVFGQSTIVAQKLIDQNAKTTRDELMAQIPNLVRKQSLNESLLENPVFSNPAVAPVVQALTEQLSQKYPKATSAELQGMAKEYLTGVAGMISPTQKATDDSSTKGKSKDANWDEYFA